VIFRIDPRIESGSGVPISADVSEPASAVSGPPTSWLPSTGSLPAEDETIGLLNEAYELYRSNRAGAVSRLYPRLAEMPSHLFGVCLMGTDGRVHAAGDAGRPFPIMSVSKPFVFALVCQVLGAGEVRRRVGVNSTGLPFNSLQAVERHPDGRTNPMVDAGAIAATSLVPGDGVEAKWRFLHEGLSRFAGRALELDRDVYASATAAHQRNQAFARMLQSMGRLYGDPDETIDLYDLQCSLEVTARDLAVMGATLAGAGVNPLTGDRIVNPDLCHYTLAVMATAGLYETSGDWLFDVGLPGTSGIGGGIVTVSPGKGGLGTFAPLLDAAGNSIKGQLAAAFLSRRLGLDLFAARQR
jgi:glutaminase